MVFASKTAADRESGAHPSVSVGCAYQAVGSELWACGSTEIPKMVLIGAGNGLMPLRTKLLKK